MPIVMHQHLRSEGEIGLWKITETEAWFRERLFLYPSELRQFGKIKGRRRVEWLATRQLVHHMSGREKRGAFIKDEYGKPHIEHSDWHISISHSHNLAAAIAAPRMVGIDIQHLVAKIDRLAHKYMRPEEMDSLDPGTRLEHLHVYWGAKEALYKAYGRRLLDFKENMLVGPFSYNLELGQTQGRIEKDDWVIEYDVHYRMVKGYILVYVMEGGS